MTRARICFVAIAPVFFCICTAATLGSATVECQGCPTRLTAILSGLRTPEVKSAASSTVVDQGFIERNGGAAALVAKLRTQIDQESKTAGQTKANYEQICEGGCDPVMPYSTAVGSQLQAYANAYWISVDMKKIAEETLKIVQCWAQQKNAGGTSGVAGGQGGSQGTTGRGSGGYGTGGNAAGDDNGASRKLQEARNKAEEKAAGLAGQVAENHTGGVGYAGSIGPKTPGQPTQLKDPFETPAASDRTAPGGSDAVNLNIAEFLSTAPAKVDGFYKRLAGSFRGTAKSAELLVEVSNVNGLIKTNDQCATLEAWYQFGLTTKNPDGTSSHTFESHGYSVSVKDGAGTTSLPIQLDGSGRVTEVRITAIKELRACSAVKSTDPKCAAALQAKEKLQDLKRQLIEKQLQLLTGIGDLDQELLSLHKEMREPTSAFTEVLTRVNTAGAVVRAGLLAIETFEVNAIKEVSLIGAAAYAALKGTSAAVDMAKLRDQSTDGFRKSLIVGKYATEVDSRLKPFGPLIKRVAAAVGIYDAIKRQHELEDLRSEVAEVAVQLERQVASLKGDLQVSDRRLADISAVLEQLNSVCSSVPSSH